VQTPLAVLGALMTRPHSPQAFGSQDHVLVDLAGHRELAGDSIDVGAAELEELTLAQAHEGGQHDEQSQALGHRVDDHRELIQGGGHGHPSHRGRPGPADLRRRPEDQLLLLGRLEDRPQEPVRRGVARPGRRI
jgi:hypothetical protein